MTNHRKSQSDHDIGQAEKYKSPIKKSSSEVHKRSSNINTQQKLQKQKEPGFFSKLFSKKQKPVNSIDSLNQQKPKKKLRFKLFAWNKKPKKSTLSNNFTTNKTNSNTKTSLNGIPAQIQIPNVELPNSLSFESTKQNDIQTIQLQQIQQQNQIIQQLKQQNNSIYELYDTLETAKSITKQNKRILMIIGVILLFLTFSMTIIISFIFVPHSNSLTEMFNLNKTSLI